MYLSLKTVLENDLSMSADQLLYHILNVSLKPGNNAKRSIREAQRLMEKNWSTER